MYNVIINFNCDFSSKTDYEKYAKFVLESVGACEDSCVSINFIDACDIKDLNFKFRNIDKPTDVLSFECDGLDDKFTKSKNFDLGDIFICPSIAMQNSKKYNVSLESEILLLITHGILHLNGYDHQKEQEARQMEAKEDEILLQWKNLIQKNI